MIWRLHILIFFINTPFFIFSQKENKQIKKAYQDFDYYRVVDLASKGERNDIELLRMMADSYKMTGNYQKAEKMMEIAVKQENKTPGDVMAYAQLLKMNSKYSESATIMEEFRQLKPKDTRYLLFSQNKTYYQELLKDKKQFSIYTIAGNSEQQDFGITFYKNKILFVSSRQPLNYLTHIWNGNRLPYVDMYTAKITPKNELKSVRKFPAFNNKYHDGPASFNKKGNYMVFCSDNYSGKSDEGVRNIKLYEAHLEKGGKWGDKKSLPFNSNDYSCGHPALSADGNTLYFASDMPGGMGGTDIYRCTRDAKGNWSKPENLGDKVNTEGNELFPFIHESGLFFFSSDGRPGLGGLDIFVMKIIDGFTSKAVNVGYPANSSKDDFAMILDAEQKKGYFSSNREGGKGNDDIYAFDLLKPFKFGKIIKGTVKNEKDSMLPEAAIFLLNKSGEILEKVCSKKDGSYLIFADDNMQYLISGIKEGYLNTKEYLETNGPNEIVTLDLVLEREPDMALTALITDKKTKTPLKNVKVAITDERGQVYKFKTAEDGLLYMDLPDRKVGDSLNFSIVISKKDYVTKTVDLKWEIKVKGPQKIHENLDVDLSRIELGEDLAKLSNLGNIYYDLGKFNIRPDAAVELDKIVQIMNENPDMVVELGSHTDCRDSKKANLVLSEKRAKASVEYIQKRITNPKRISGKGYGESKLLNNCDCEGNQISPCTEAEHAINRRTEFIILKTANN